MAYIGWARVSSQGQDLSHQIERLKEYGCTKVFEGKHSGKAETNRDALEALLAFVREGDVVVITKLDRLGRSLKQVLNVLDELKNKNINVLALDQPIDTTNSSPMAQAMTQLLGVFAELERSFIITRTQEGKVATGRYGGRPKKLNNQQIQEVITRHRAGESIASLARVYQVSRMTVTRCLARAESKCEVA